MANYDLPNWVNQNPAQLINQAIQSSRARHDQEQSTQFEQNRQTDQDEMQRQQFEMQKQAAARKLAADYKFQSATSGLDPTAPDYTSKYRSAMLQHAAETGEFGAGFGPAINALKPAPTFQPLAMPGTSPAPAAAAPAGGTGPTPAPVDVTPGAAPAAPSFAHPAGFIGGKYIPAQFPPTPKPVTAPKPIVTRPGEVVLDPVTKQPTYTNTTQLPSKTTGPIAPRVVPPGGVVFDQGKPVFTNSTPKAVTGKDAEPLALPKSKDDLKMREVYQTSKGPAWWDGDQFHLLK